MIGFFVQSFLTTLRSPRNGINRILDLHLSEQVGAIALAITSIASALMFHLSGLLALDPREQEVIESLFGPPIVTAIWQVAMWFVAAFFLWKIGAWRGGQGNWAQSLIAIAWMQTIMVVLQFVQIVIGMVSPTLAGYISMFSIGFFFVMAVLFTREVHRFKNTFLVVIGVILTSMLIVLLLSIIATLFISPEALTHGL